MTKERAAAIKIVDIIFDTIKETGDQGIPSGHLYAMLMEYMSLETYNTIINTLKLAGRVKETNYLLTAI